MWARNAAVQRLQDNDADKHDETQRELYLLVLLCAKHNV